MKSKIFNVLFALVLVLGFSLVTHTPVLADETPTVAFVAASSSGDEGTTPANLAVSLSVTSTLTVTVDYTVTGGTATGGDFALAAGRSPSLPVTPPRHLDCCGGRPPG